MAQLKFRDRRVLAELTWTTTILLPKGKGEYMGMDLVGVIWKIITTIINNHFCIAIYLHDALHGFRQGRGAGTATLEEKLAQHLVKIFHKPFV